MLNTYERIAWVVGVACVIAYMAIAWSKSIDRHVAEYNEEIALIKESHDADLLKLRDAEREKLEKLTLAHEAALRDIEREHDEKLRALNDRKAKQIVKDVEQFNEDPRVVANKIAEMLPGVTVR